MKAFVTILRELWGLFVDDGSLALALVFWCAVAGLILPHLPLTGGWNGPVLFVGCLAILLVDVGVAVRRRKMH
jgi:hypothetical protein